MLCNSIQISHWRWLPCDGGGGKAAQIDTIRNTGKLRIILKFSYTQINFAAFAMLGLHFCPRIRGVQHQRIYRIDPNCD